MSNLNQILECIEAPKRFFEYRNGDGKAEGIMIDAINGYYLDEVIKGFFSININQNAYMCIPLSELPRFIKWLDSHGVDRAEEVK